MNGEIDELWEPLVAHGMQWCAPNVHADVHWLDAGDVCWRVSVTRVQPRNSYIVSATGQYYDYAYDEIKRLPSVVQRAFSRAGMSALSPMLKSLDPIVVLDALPVSTVLHVLRSEAQWAAGLAAVRAEFPSLPIVVRSLDSIGSGRELTMLEGLGMRRMLSRLVFHQDPRVDSFWRIRNVQHDVRMVAETPIPWHPLVAADAPDVARLYWQLYGEKHSLLNPHFSEAWIAHGIAKGALFGDGLHVDGRLAAAFLSYRVNDMMTNPVFGYDTTLPQSLGLYRRLSVRTMELARELDLRIHASSGAPGFKASRGGVASIEYHAVDLRGVRAVQRWCWQTDIAVTNAVGPRLLRNAK
jgi:Acetyltransferase (GNAT) domain